MEGCLPGFGENSLTGYCLCLWKGLPSPLFPVALGFALEEALSIPLQPAALSEVDFGPHVLCGSQVAFSVSFLP